MIKYNERFFLEKINNRIKGNKNMPRSRAEIQKRLNANRMGLENYDLTLYHLDGWNMEIADGNILGRTNGPHAAMFSKFPVRIA